MTGQSFPPSAESSPGTGARQAPALGSRIPLILAGCLGGYVAATGLIDGSLVLILAGLVAFGGGIIGAATCGLRGAWRQVLVAVAALGTILLLVMGVVTAADLSAVVVTGVAALLFVVALFLLPRR